MLLALMALLADGAARHESVTFDEVAHIGAGVSYLQKQDMRMNEEHPPLAKVLAAVPLVIRGVHADYSQVSWAFSGSGLFKQILGEWIFGHWVIARWNQPRADGLLGPSADGASDTSSGSRSLSVWLPAG